MLNSTTSMAAIISAAAIILLWILIINIVNGPWRIIRHNFIKSLEGKHVFITGGSRGIGLAIAKKALAEGALITLVSRDSANLSSAVDALLLQFQCGRDRIRFEAVDVKDFEALARAIRGAHGWNAIDVLVCNAGLTRGGYLGAHGLTAEDIRSVIDTNLVGVINALHAALPLLTSRSLNNHPISIVIIGSLSSMFFMYGHSIYTATKYALKGLAESLRFELLPYDNIRVSFVCPAFANTQLLDEVDKHEEIRGLMRWANLYCRKYAESPNAVAMHTVEAIKTGSFLVTTSLFSFVVSVMGGRGCIPVQSSWMRFIMETILFIPSCILYPLAVAVIKFIIIRSRRRHLL